MTVREALAESAERVHERLERALDSEDAVIVLMDRSGTLSICHGFGASGCQLELVSNLLERALQELRPPHAVKEEQCLQPAHAQL